MDYVEFGMDCIQVEISEKCQTDLKKCYHFDNFSVGMPPESFRGGHRFLPTNGTNLHQWPSEKDIHHRFLRYIQCRPEAGIGPRVDFVMVVVGNHHKIRIERFPYGQPYGKHQNIE